MTHIIAMKDMTDKFRVTMGSVVKKALFVHMPNKIVVINQLENILYGMDPRDCVSYISEENYEVKNVQTRNTVDDNLKYMSDRQQKRAKAARKAYQAISTPTTQDFKAMIRVNLMKNKRVTTNNINLAKKTFGPDVGEIRGKTTRSRSTVAISNAVEMIICMIVYYVYVWV